MTPIPMTSFSDDDLLKNNIVRINKRDMRALRVSAEHYLWLARQIGALETAHRGAILAIVDAAGGEVEGHPTSSINILQRIRAMRTELCRLRDRPLHCPGCDGDHL